jgi:hypothetical protein
VQARRRADGAIPSVAGWVSPSTCFHSYSVRDMAGLELRDRFYTPRVARAIMSPLGVLAAGGGVAVGLAVGLPVAAAAAVGAGAWGMRVAAAMRPRDRGERIDPFTLQEPWRGFVQDALANRAKFRQAADRTRSGPLQDTLQGISGRIDTGVDEAWQVARRGHELVESRRQIDTATIDRELSEAQAEQAGTTDDPNVDQMVTSLQAQRATADRMDHLVDTTRSQLRLLDARMGEAVVRALELSTAAVDDRSLSSLSSDVDSLVTDLEALRQALDETHGTGTGGGLPAAGETG